jgi:hypothetical protein
MNDTANDQLKSLQSMNEKIEKLNVHLKELIKLRQKDKLEWLRSSNVNFIKINTILSDILDSRKGDKIRNELDHTK